MVEEAFHAHIEDDEGNVIVNQLMLTMKNGFIDLWLFRNRTYIVTIEYQDKKAVESILTFAECKTRVTTMRFLRITNFYELRLSNKLYLQFLDAPFRVN